MFGPQVQFVNNDQILYQGNKLLYLAGIDYHRLASNTDVLDAASKAVLKYGISATGSRTTTGNHVVYDQLESKIAKFLGAESAITLPSGYLSNLAIIQAVYDEFDIIIIDNKAHSSLYDAAKWTEKPIIEFDHLNPQNLKDKLGQVKAKANRPLLLSDGVFAARGEIAPLNEYCEIISHYNGRILLDDSHAIAVLGETGKGTLELDAISRDIVYQSGTLGKGFGTAGGIVAGSRQLIDSITNKSLSFSGSTGLPLPIAAAAIKSIELVQNNMDWITSLQAMSLSLKEKLIDIGFNMPLTPCPILSITYNDQEKNQRLRDILLKNCIFPPFINYPGAPQGGHFRFILTSNTSKEQVELLYNTIKLSL